MSKLKNDEIRQAVRKTYGKIAIAGGTSCGCGTPPTETASNPAASSCCGSESGSNMSATDVSIELGYSDNDVNSVPQGANMGLGCGNPQAIAALKPGEIVLDLGSGGGFDCFLAAKAVGEKGRVIGIDMTPDMISKARQNTEKTEFKNVEFRLGEIENLPVADNTVNVIISNCVINLSPDKGRVFNETFRILKPGGRLAISDIVATAVLPEELQNDLALLTGCMSGASQIEDLESMLETTGFTNISIKPKDESKKFIRTWAPGTTIEDFVISATIEAVKP